MLNDCAVRVLPDEGEGVGDSVFERTNRWSLDSAFERAANGAVEALVVWDGLDGLIGGTSSFVRDAESRGMPVERIDPADDVFAVRRARLAPGGPKRILALDGGGVRGAISVGFLARIEALLRERTGRDDLVLRDYFDLVGGTSTGAILAAGIAVGMDAAALEALYRKLPQRVFGQKRRWWNKWWIAKYDEGPLMEVLTKHLGDRRLNDPEIPCGLCIVTKRADSGSTWPIHNHPGGQYFERNGRIRLWRAVRASTAAPTYFQPEKIEFQPNKYGAFVDGGVSMANDPSLLLMLMSTLRGYGFRWPLGEDELLLVSVGTGTWSKKKPWNEVIQGQKGWRRMLGGKAFWDWAVEVPEMLMSDARDQNQLLLQYLSTTLTGVHIDNEVGDLADDLLHGIPALTYARYDATLETKNLSELGIGTDEEELKTLRALDSVTGMKKLLEIGCLEAERQVSAEHLPRAFDL